jgi:hypothetical protein
VANTLNSFRKEAVGFIDWLGVAVMLLRRASAISLHLLDIRQGPGLVEVGFQRRVESESREPRLAGHGLNCVCSE